MAGDACPACTRPWVQYLAKEGRVERRRGRGKKERPRERGRASQEGQEREPAYVFVPFSLFHTRERTHNLTLASQALLLSLTPGPCICSFVETHEAVQANEVIPSRYCFLREAPRPPYLDGTPLLGSHTFLKLFLSLNMCPPHCP